MRGSRKGKKVANWRFRIDEKPFVAVLKYIDGNEEPFRAQITFPSDFQLEITGKDPKAMKEEMERGIRAKHGIRWTPMLLISVKTQKDDYGMDDSDGMTVSYGRIFTGRLNGKMVWKRTEQTWRDFDRGDPRICFEKEETRAIIPDTPENAASLDAIIEALGSMRKRVQDLMGQKKIEKTISHSGLLLPMAAGK